MSAEHMSFHLGGFFRARSEILFNLLSKLWRLAIFLAIFPFLFLALVLPNEHQVDFLLFIFK